MISNPSLIFYACIANKETILGEVAKEPGIGALAQKCIAKTPPHHALYAHTVRKRTYLFSIGDPFVLFGIFDQDLVQSEAIVFLTELRTRLILDFDGRKLEPHCFQDEFDTVMEEVTAPEVDPELVLPPPMLGSRMDEEDSGSGKGKRMMVLTPLLGSNGGLKKKKKKRLSGEVCKDAAAAVVNSSVEKQVEVCEDVRDFAMPAQQKTGLHSCERQKAKQVWRKHVRVVLILDLFVCVVLFGVWLWVCRGFKCIEG